MHGWVPTIPIWGCFCWPVQGTGCLLCSCKLQLKQNTASPCLHCTNKRQQKKDCKKKISLPRVFIKLEQPRVCRAMLLQWCRVTLQNAPCQHVFHSFLGTGCLRIILLEKTARDPPPFSCWAHLFAAYKGEKMLSFEIFRNLSFKKNTSLQYTIHNDDGCLPFSFEELLGLLRSQWRHPPSTIWCTVGVAWYPSQDASVAVLEFGPCTALARGSLRYQMQLRI